MMGRKYQEKIYEKYLGKTQRMIDVLNSCQTGDQVDACDEWARNLFDQWDAYEMRLLEERYCHTVARSVGLIKTFRHLKGMFKLSVDRKWVELSKKEEK